MKKRKVGIIGCGVIGSAFAKAVCGPFARQTQLSFLCDRTPEKAERLKHLLRNRSVPVVSLFKLIEASDIVIEAASASIAADVAKKGLSQGKDVLIMSVGGLLERAKDFLNPSRGRLWIPSGAVAGIDALLAAKEGGLKQVRLITRKPPEGLREAPYFLRKKFPSIRDKKEVCIFKGSASEAVKGFPQNINVAAILSLAGIGPYKTQVEIWTSRVYSRNQHEVILKGDFGEIRTRTQNVPSPQNPKTSLLAVCSAVATLRRMLSCVQIGT